MKNTGLIDRYVRVSFALIILYLFMNNALVGFIGYLALAIAGILFLTGLFGTCPLYSLFGINTTKNKKM